MAFAVPPPLDDHLCLALYSASLAIGRAYKPLLDGLGLTYPQYLVLGVLWEADGRTLDAVAARLSLEPGAVTPLVQHLRRRGLVGRRPHPEDAREAVLTLTEAGWRLRERCGCLADTLVEASGLSVERIRRLTGEVVALREVIAGATGRDPPDTVSAGRTERRRRTPPRLRGLP